MPQFGARMVVGTANYKHIESRKKDMEEREKKLWEWRQEKARRLTRLKSLRSNSTASVRSDADNFTDIAAAAAAVRRQSEGGNSAAAAAAATPPARRSASVHSGVGIGRSPSINSALDHSDKTEIIGGGKKKKRKGVARRLKPRSKPMMEPEPCCGDCYCTIL